MSYIEPNKEDLVLHSKYIINFDENYNFDNVKQLKSFLIGLIDDNLDENQEWLNNDIKPIIPEIDDKTYCMYYEGYYIAERNGYYEDNTITIVRAEAYRVNRNNALSYVKSFDVN